MDNQINLSDLLYSNKLDVKKFERLISNNSQGYKFYWLEAILRILPDGKDEILFDEIVNEMIWEAWRTVSHFHLRLGPAVNGKVENFLEHAIRVLNECAKDELSTKIPSHDMLIRLIKKYDVHLNEDKIHLTDYVPYRLIKPFVGKEGKDYVDHKQYNRFISYLNKFTVKNNEVFYDIIDAGCELDRKIRVNDNWRLFMLDNYSVIMGWLQYNKAKYVQDRNPGVPGVMYKVSPEVEDVRRLEYARTLWKLTVTLTGNPLYEIYTNNELDIDKFDLDHFVPRSYTSSDELWNLIPMSKSLNSSKSNRLPPWEPFFKEFANYQYYLYTLLFCNENESQAKLLMEQYIKCEKYNVNAIWAAEKLYIAGNSEIQFKNILKENLEVVYTSAKLQEYELWEI